MKYDYLIAEVAGSKTVLVTSRVKKERRADVANELLETVEGSEHVGFLMLPRLGGDYRVETPGEDFCGNTMLAAAYRYGKEHGTDSVRIEISGCEDFITVTLQDNEACAEIPLPYYREKSEFSGMEAMDIVFDGVSQTVVYTEEQFPPGKMRFFLISRTSRYHVPAAGIVLVNEKENKLTSAVYAEKTDNLCAETGSVTAAAAVAYDKLAAGDEKECALTFNQSGETVSAVALREENEISGITVKANIEMID